MRYTRQSGRCAMAIVLAVWCSGCEFPPRLWAPASDRAARPELDVLSSEALYRDLARFVDFADAEVTRASETIESEAVDDSVRRAALQWKLRILPDMEHSLVSKEPIQMLIDTWALWVRMSHYLTEGEGKKLFQDQQSVAVQATKAILEEIEQISTSTLGAEQATRTAAKIQEYTQKNPITGVFAYDSATEFGETAEAQSILGTVFGAFTHIRQGLDPTMRLSRSVDRFTDLMKDYPAMVREQAQLLLMDLEENKTVALTAQSLESLSQATSQFADTAEVLPDQLRQDAQIILDDLEKHYPEWQEIVAGARETLEAFNASMEQLDGTVQALTAAGQAWEGTAEAATLTVKQLQEFGKDGAAAETSGTDEGMPPKRPFDIEDYQKTVQSLTESASEFRSLLQDVDAFLGEGSLQDLRTQTLTAGSDVLAETDATLRGIIDFAFRRLLIVIAVVFVLVVGYRLARRRRADHPQESR